MCSCVLCQPRSFSSGGVIPAPRGSYHSLTGWQNIGAIADEAFEFAPKKKPELEKVHGAFRMFRVWKMTDEGKLRGCVADFTWSEGENASLTSGGDASRDSGFYGFSSLEELQRQESKWWDASQSGEGVHRDVNGAAANRFVFSAMGWCPDCGSSSHSACGGVGAAVTHYICGTTLNYGHMKISDLGARSQYAVPEYIIEPDGSDPDFGLRVLNVAEKYGMQIISLSEARSLRTGLVPWWKGRPNR